MKRYILIAGVNGAGKSTLYQTLQNLQSMPRINSDEIVRQFGDWRNLADVMRAGKISVERISRFIDEGTSFNQETTLCGRSIIKNIKQAKRQGYFIELHYVGLENVELAKMRVSDRVKRGGHGVPEQDIEKRYIETFSNLKAVLPICDLTAFYDNTVGFRRFAIYQNGRPVRVSQNIPQWYKTYVETGAFPLFRDGDGDKI